MPFIPFLAVSFPESLVLYYMVFTLVRKKVSFLFITVLSLLTSLFSFIIRSIPVVFGVHSVLQVILMVVLLIFYSKLPVPAAIVSVILSSAVLGLTEGIFVPIWSRIFSLDLDQIISVPLLRILFTLPHLLFLAFLTHFLSKRQWKLPFISQVKGGGNCETYNGTVKQLLRQTSVLGICLVQALTLILLKISFDAYISGVYPSFTLDTLVEISSLVLIIAAFATIFIASYLLRSIEREAKLETELRHIKERHKLNLQLQIERHDFYNHLTAIYGYIKSGHYNQAENYIENLYGTVSQISKLLKINPPELSAILSAKHEEAKAEKIEFNWQVSIDSNNLPLSSENLTHLVGNLLDNALEASKASCSPKVDLILISNGMGLWLKVSNNGNPIPQNARHNLFNPGFTSKDKSMHSGLGLYIIKQIIDRYNGCLKINTPENYPGVEFEIYLPWSN